MMSRFTAPFRTRPALSRALLIRSALAAFSCSALLSVTAEAQAQPKAAKVRYGKFPISGKGLRRLKRDLQRDTQTLHANQLACRNKQRAKKLSFCDADNDGLVNSREKFLGTNPLRKDTDQDGLSDLEELLKTHTDPLSANAHECPADNFDKDGNTIEFEIPQGTVGNITRGATWFAQTCHLCHASAEAGTDFSFSQLKTRIGQPPMNITGFSDARIADLVAYLNRTQTGLASRCIIGGPVPTLTATPTPVGTGTPQATPTAPGCANSYFDANGNSTQFGIAPLTGNLSTGGAFYVANCNSCHTGEATHGLNMTMSQLKASVTGPKMGINTVTDQQYADMTAYLNRAMAPQNCPGVRTPTPTPTLGGGTRTPTPTATPVVTPTPPGCSNQYFDASGNTTAFAIPAPLSGNLGTGSSYYNLSCNGCHTGEATHGLNMTFTQLKAAVTGPKMNINSISDQQYADMTAYLNRAMAPQNCGGSPTPTPISDYDAGKIVFQVTCQTCHTRASSLRGLTSSGFREAIREVRQMSGISLSAEQLRVLLIYLKNP